MRNTTPIGFLNACRSTIPCEVVHPRFHVGVECVPGGGATGIVQFPNKALHVGAGRRDLTAPLELSQRGRASKRGMIAGRRQVN